MNTLRIFDFQNDYQEQLEENEVEQPIPHLWGPINRQAILPGQDIVLMTTTLFEMDEVRIYAFADADIDLFVYDRFGILVAHDTRPGGTPACALTPVGTGEYLIKLVNNATHPIEYVLHTA